MLIKIQTNAMKKIIIFTLMTISCATWSQALLEGQLSPADQTFKEEVLRANHIPQLLQVAMGTAEKQQWQRHLIVWERLASLQPFNAEFQYELAKSYAKLDNKTGAYNALVALQNAGLSYPVKDVEEFKGIQGTKVYDYIVDEMAANGTHYGEGEVVATVGENYSGMLFENLAYDVSQKRFLLASIRSGEIYQIDDKGALSSFINPVDPEKGPWGAVDIVVDSNNESFWVASASMPHFNGVTEGNIGNADIAHYRLSDGKLIKQYDLSSIEAPKLLSALHLGKDGSLYFLNVFNQTIYQLPADSDKAEEVISLPGLTAIKAITSNADDSHLYVSDFEQGLFVINKASKQTAAMDPKRQRFFSGINDLFYIDGDLVAIQSGVSPARVMRFDLNQDMFINTSYPLEAAHPAFDTLGNAVLVSDSIYYVANSQWDKMDMGGNLRSDAKWEPIQLIKSPVAYRLKEHRENQQRMEKIKKQRGIK